MSAPIYIYRLLDPHLGRLRRKEYGLRFLAAFSAASFALAFAAGAALCPYIVKPAYDLVLAPSFKGVDLVAASLGGTAAASAFAIFIKNSTAVAATVLLARRTRGISVLLLLILNGLLIGSVLSLLYTGGTPLKYLAAGVLAHGVLEFTALFWGAACGLKLLLLSEDNFEHLRKKVLLWCCGLAGPALLAAAVLEAYVTPQLLDLL